MRKFTFILAASALLFAVACTNSSKNRQNNDEIVTATINNSKGQTLDITYNTTEKTATIVFNGETIVLKQQPSASGIRYSNDTYEYTEWQNEIELTKNGKVIFSNKEKSGMTNNFVDAEGKILTVTHDTSGDIPTAAITYEDYKDVILAQVPESVWAKGGEYKSNTIRWVTNENGGDLIVNGKTISFKAQQ